uniref:Uncharacterized protein n=1 Tax=Anguilla anguilla TaxID=7936 RepID=A0A0E9QYM9_ANGAN
MQMASLIQVFLKSKQGSPV